MIHTKDTFKTKSCTRGKLVNSVHGMELIMEPSTPNRGRFFIMTNHEIWKFEVPLTDEILIKIPKGGKILSLQLQRQKPCIWVLVNPLNEKESRMFEWYVTGGTLAINEKSAHIYIGTCQLFDGDYVLHLFEREY